VSIDFRSRLATGADADGLVTVAMSGGVDSSVALKILMDYVSARPDNGIDIRLYQPIHVHVLFMRNWDPELSESDPPSSKSATSPGLADLAYSSEGMGSQGKSACSWERDWEDVQRVCKHLGVQDSRVKMVDFSKEYWTRVFEPCVGIWEGGGTPNPDVMCNR
jgi:tRNA U34 2-thiouridine synthase MnmA/TrmU